MADLAFNITKSIFTAIRNGETGGTFNVNGKSVPDSGYFVGGVVPSLINPTPAQVLAFIETVGTDYVGFWEDSETLALYIDAVDHVYTAKSAARLCEIRHEIAYFDVSTSQEVRV